MLPTLDAFNDSINRLNYANVAKILQAEQNQHEEIEMQAPPIV